MELGEDPQRDQCRGGGVAGRQVMEQGGQFIGLTEGSQYRRQVLDQERTGID